MFFFEKGNNLAAVFLGGRVGREKMVLEKAFHVSFDLQKNKRPVGENRKLYVRNNLAGVFFDEGGKRGNSFGKGF